MKNFTALLAIVVLHTGCAVSDKMPTAPKPNHVGKPTDNFSARFEEAKNNENRASEFETMIRLMPKGGELHSHFSGAVQVPEFLKIAEQEGYRAAFTVEGGKFCGFAFGTAGGAGFEAASNPSSCGTQAVTYRSISELNHSAAATLLESVRDTLTVEHEENDSEQSGYGQFRFVFSVVGSLTGDVDHMGALFESIMTDAYEDGVSYLELMLNPIGRTRLVKTGDAWEQQVVSIVETVDIIKRDIGRANEKLRERWHAEQRYLPPGTQAGEWPKHWPEPVEVRIIIHSLRSQFGREGSVADSTSPSPIDAIRCVNDRCPSRLEQSYYLASIRYQDLIVGIDLVGLPETDYQSGVNPDIDLEGEIGRLRLKYGHAPIRLHAGETHQPDRFHHITQAVALGTRRIGHAYSVSLDQNAQDIVCRYRIPLEISLTSNYRLNVVDSIEEHPFPDYYRGTTCGTQGVYFPVTLNTDDAGIFETNMTKEYILAIKTFDLTWPETKQLAQNGLVYGFMNKADKAALINRWQEEVAAFEKHGHR